MFGLLVPVMAYVHKRPFSLSLSPTWSCRAPLDCVDLLLVGGEVVHRVVPVHAPDLQRHVVAARGQELPLRVPLDGIHLVGVALGEDISIIKFNFSF